MIIAGNKIYEQCGWCGKYVNMTGLFAGLHLCLTDEEKQAKQAIARQQQAMQIGQVGGQLGGQVGSHVDLHKLLSQIGGSDLAAKSSKAARTHTKSAQTSPPNNDKGEI